MIQIAKKMVVMCEGCLTSVTSIRRHKIITAMWRDAQVCTCDASERQSESTARCSDAIRGALEVESVQFGNRP